MDLKVPQGLKHPDCQSFTISRMYHIPGYDQENHTFKVDLIVEAKINIFLFQNDKGKPLNLVSSLEYLKHSQIIVLNI